MVSPLGADFDEVDLLLGEDFDRAEIDLDLLVLEDFLGWWRPLFLELLGLMVFEQEFEPAPKVSDGDLLGLFLLF